MVTCEQGTIISEVQTCVNKALVFYLELTFFNEASEAGELVGHAGEEADLVDVNPFERNERPNLSEVGKRVIARTSVVGILCLCDIHHPLTEARMKLHVRRFIHSYLQVFGL